MPGSWRHDWILAQNPFSLAKPTLSSRDRDLESNQNQPSTIITKSSNKPSVSISTGSTAFHPPSTQRWPSSSLSSHFCAHYLRCRHLLPLPMYPNRHPSRVSTIDDVVLHYFATRLPLSTIICVFLLRHFVDAHTPPYFMFHILFDTTPYHH